MIGLARLREHAVHFRTAIECCDRAALPITFECFPRGSCGDATLLLGKFLEDSGFGHFDYVLGERDGCSHAWLAKGDIVVDITADQFNDVSHRVIVERNSQWHSSFQGEVQHVADFDIYDERTRLVLRAAYRLVVGANVLGQTAICHQ